MELFGRRAKLQHVAEDGDAPALRPDLRLAAMAELTAAAVPTRLFAMPVLPDDADPEGFGISYLEAGGTLDLNPGSSTWPAVKSSAPPASPPAASRVTALSDIRSAASALSVFGPS